MTIKYHTQRENGKMDEDDYGYDEGSDIDNWEAEQVFQDQQAEQAAEWDDYDESDYDDADDDLPYDDEQAAEMRAEYAMEAALGFGE